MEKRIGLSPHPDYKRRWTGVALNRINYNTLLETVSWENSAGGDVHSTDDNPRLLLLRRHIENGGNETPPEG